MTVPSITQLKLPAIRRALQGTGWAIERSKLEAMMAVLEAHAIGGVSAERVRAEGRAAYGDRNKPVPTKSGGIQVLPLYGVIAHRMDLFTEYSGGTSTQRFADQFDAAMNDPNISAIVIDVDSPGGSVDGTPELAKQIYDARGQGKDLIAVVNTLDASAAYWISSACDQIVASPSAMVGSIGVFMVHLDESDYDDKVGLTYTLISAGKYKTEGNRFEPLGDEARAALQAQVDEYYTMFTAAVAKNRGVAVKDVRNGYGEGRCLSATAAKAAGMIDRIDTLAGMLGKLGARNISPSGRIRQASALDATIADVARRQVEGALGALPFVAGADGPDPEDQDDELDPGDAPLCPECGAPMNGPKCTKCDYEAPDDSADANAAAGRAAAVPDDLPDHSPAPMATEQTMPQENAAPSSNGAGNAEAIRAEERRRAHEIRQIGAELLARNVGVQQVTIDRAVDEGFSVEQAQSAFNADIRAGHQATPGIRVGTDREAMKPFATFGDQLMAIIQAGTPSGFKVAGLPGGYVDKRLRGINDRAAQVERQFYAGTPSGMNESVGSEGGFFVSPDFLPGIIDPVFENDPVLARTFRIPSGNVSVKYNVVDETSRATGSRWGGMQLFRSAEADQATKKKPALRQMELTKKKLIGLAYLTDELNLDAPAANALITRAFQSELGFALADEVFRGKGAGQMLGFLNAGCTYSRAIEATQTIANSNTFIALNAAKMLASVPPALWGDAIWLYNAELLATLMTAIVGTGGSSVPVWLGANGISGKPYDSILGRPAFASELCEPVGTPGDIVLIVPNQFHVLMDEGAIQATSLHLRFDFDEMVLRITHRSDGAPVWRSTVTKYKGAQPWSPFVTLAVRS